MDDSVQGLRLRRIVLSLSQHAVLPVSLPWKTKTHEMVKSVEALPPADLGRDQQCYFLSTWHSLPPQRHQPTHRFSSICSFLICLITCPFHWLAPCRHPYLLINPHLASALLNHFCPSLSEPAQQDQSSKKQMWNSSQKAGGRPDWPLSPAEMTFQLC